MIYICYIVHSQGKQTNIELHPRLLVATSLKKMLQIMQLVYNNRAQQSSHSNIIKLIYCKQESFPRQLSKGFDLVIVARKSNRRLRCSVADLGQKFYWLDKRAQSQSSACVLKSMFLLPSAIFVPL